MCALKRARLWSRHLRDRQRLSHGTAQLPAAHGGKRGTKPIYAAEILVAAGLINLPFSPQWGLEGQQRDAIGLHPAITAAFADIWIDKQALIWIGKGPPFASAPLLSRAGLHIDNNRNARQLPKALLHCIKLRTRMHLNASWKISRRDVFFFVINHSKVFHTDPAHLLHDPRRIQSPIIVLSACHRHGVIEQNFVSHRRASGDRCANGLNA